MGGSGSAGRFSRTELLLGEEGIDRLAASTVAVFGLGGVGSFTVEALARAGVGHLVLIDHDVVDVSNVNRQLHALTDTIGKRKTDLMGDRVRRINPDAVVDTISEFYLPDNADRFFQRKYDYVVDAIDTVTSKIDLVLQCRERGVPIISCMGAGNKLHPELFEIADIYSTSVDPLARVMRKKLKEHQIKSLKVVYSKEVPVVQTGVVAGQSGTLSENTDEGCKLRGKKRAPGSISFVPSVAGLILAGEVVRDLASA
ncbi:MAG: tRNA threonylcarbamoyladenosine dehydratase [Selenomonadaceae bacterium]|nr:tRNA threonylcarbamoyladenosine dehydratase [Selenomonadaceae bacterium]